jgi:hypothetical protein
MDVYELWLLSCSSHENVSKWLEENFSYDKEILVKHIESAKKGQLPEVLTPKETFLRKKGICFESSWFAKDSLNKINPTYKAEVIFIFVNETTAHVVCSFWLDKEMYIMDYGTKIESMIGTYGPFNGIDDYVRNFFLKKHPTYKTVISYFFGWPESVYKKWKEKKQINGE